MSRKPVVTLQCQASSEKHVDSFSTWSPDLTT